MLWFAALACTGTTKFSESGHSGAGTDTGSVEILLDEVGVACVFGDGLPDYGNTGMGGETTFVADQTADVQVVLEDCASGCTSDIATACEVVVDAGSVIVTASGSYRVPSGSPTCASVCVPIIATCTTEALPAGTWTVSYADAIGAPFDVPGTGLVPCAP